MKKKSTIIIAVLAGVLVLGAATVVIAAKILRENESNITPYQVITEGSAKKVYVAMDKSEWKEAAVKSVTDSFKGKVNFTVENLGTLSGLKMDEWDAVMVVSTFYGGALQDASADFIRNASAKDKVLLVGTSGTTKIQDTGVDTLSAASSDGDAVFAEIASRLAKKLGL